MTDKGKTTTELLIYAIILMSITAFLGFYVGSSKQPKIIIQEKIVAKGECSYDLENWQKLKEIDDQMVVLTSQISANLHESFDVVYNLNNPVINENIEKYNTLAKQYTELDLQRQLLIKDLY